MIFFSISQVREISAIFVSYVMRMIQKRLARHVLLATPAR